MISSRNLMTGKEPSAEQDLVPPMTIAISTEFIAELDKAVETVSPERRCEMLRRVTALFLATAERLSATQVSLFDDVFARLLRPADVRTLADLSTVLADLASPPGATVRYLAFHEDAAVAAPLLLKSASLSESDLLEISNSCSQQHRLAISGRKNLSEALTDSILMRGDTIICRALARNSGARLSKHGYSILVGMAERDDELASSLIPRSDVPPEVLRGVLSRLNRASRSRLLKTVPTPIRQSIEAAIEDVESCALTKAPEQIDYSEAKSRVMALNKGGRLNDSSVNRFAVHGEQINLIAALSLLATVPIELTESLMEESDGYGLMVACRAARLNWHTTQAVVTSRTCSRRFSAKELERTRATFEGLCLSVAQRTIRFGSASDYLLAMTSPSSEDQPAPAGSV